ncbi:hypothetical protein M2459_001221 [Parabacteroides sp. PF5-5]|uniref:DUF6057 family protein n=1 Tax=unclassified Parabacteroides TaxID=2649774 RepID=UPI00247570CD|nr:MULTISPECIES: DUF6057 family protein [unclassified Parabacteroides]MDH6304488.1 hypothetical protein [Parabacteroides sp. PH5-39]MDH6315359.1 hypothetical protein [Parabacteroides sp. PF5-13]MDH6319147.1 hypothetical protein [Parabacteroides sp. PH5-13]MDH6322877.1 hypothetical protein [Parabacteroides sp. PH5-8]MDH6326551.1 hypothetical protein [Parabacteroides sp. PH5-41]
MKNKQMRYASWSLSLLFALGAFVFFAGYYCYHLVYQEQFQLFMFSFDYLAQTTHKPGGFAEYISRFLVQYFYTPWLGGLIITLLLSIMQRQVLSISLKVADKPAYIPLTFIPSLFYWFLLCDEHYMVAGIVALVLVLAAVQMYNTIRPAVLRIVYVLLMIPLLYLLAGGTCIVFALLCVLLEILKKEIDTRKILFFVVGCILLMLCAPLVAKAILPQYPLSKLWVGVDYYRLQQLFPSTIWFLWILIVCIPLFFRLLPDVQKTKHSFIWIGIQIVLLVLLSGYGISLRADWQKEEVMAYDYLIRKQRWAEVVEMADKKAPSTPLSVAFLNLALCKQGLMADKMFHYYQNGSEGLLPTFIRDFAMPMMAGEIYYHTGFVNTAQRFAFEAMEGIPDFQKSGRAVKRLAETNIINGEYTVAVKYLRMLQQTVYYKRWATQALAVIQDENEIELIPEWAELRRYRTKTDFLFSEEEKDQMLGILLQQDYTNRIAYEYLMAYCLLTKDLSSFFNYYPLGKEIQYRQIPKSYQEALIYLWGLTNKDLSAIPYLIHPEVMQRVQEYGKIYATYQKSEPMLGTQFSDTYWFYLHFRK